MQFLGNHGKNEKTKKKKETCNSRKKEETVKLFCVKTELSYKKFFL